MTTSEDMMIVKLPYGDVEARLHARDANLELTSYEQSSYKSYFESAVETNTATGIENVYIYPHLRSRISNPSRGQKNRDALTTFPVVYIVVIKLSDKQLQENWLKQAVGDKLKGKLDPYKTKYVIYVGETNDIVRRTSQHLSHIDTSMVANFELDEDNVPHNVQFVIEEQTLADQVICKAVADGIRVKQYVIWDEYFTKSMTLDLEHRFIDYAKSLPDVFTLNGRGNPQRNYYKSAQKDKVCSSIWRELSLDDPELFPPEHDIWNSELYKVSPFHSLGEEQKLAVNTICDSVSKLLAGSSICGESFAELGSATSQSRLIVLEGASGTGKSIVLSTLFVRLSEALRKPEAYDTSYAVKPNNSVCLVVNQDQQETLYENLAIKIGLMRTRDNDENRVVYRPNEFLSAIRAGKRECPEVVLIDEAHLLYMRPDRSYPRYYHGNQLYDILLRAKVAIAVFDPVQVVRSRNKWPQDLVSSLSSPKYVNSGGSIQYIGPVVFNSHSNATQKTDSFNTYHITLTEQFRVKATVEQLDWLDRLCDPAVFGMCALPEANTSNPYDIRVYKSPNDLEKTIRRRATEESKRIVSTDKLSAPLCRLLATYDWPYDTSSSYGEVQLYKVGNTWLMPTEGKPPVGYSGKPEDVFIKRWNYSVAEKNSEHVWSSDLEAEEEVGSYFSIQGFDLNYAGVIIGPSITYRNGRVVVDSSKSMDNGVNGKGVNNSGADTIILQQLKILLRRAIKGTYLFAVDPELQAALEHAAKASGSLY